MVKVIIFDFFDVIHPDRYNAWLKKYGYVREGNFMVASENMDSGKTSMQEFFQELSTLSDQSVQSIAQEFEENAEINQGVLKLITTLRQKYKIGLLSNAESVLLRTILKKNDLEKYFDEIVISSEVGYTKPSKNIFEIIVKRFKVSAAEVLFIDDNRRHTKAAEDIGIKSIVFQSSTQLEDDLVNFLK